MRPSTDETEVRRRLAETSAARGMMITRGSPGFSGVKDVRASLQRADMGGVLNTRELLDIAGACSPRREPPRPTPPATAKARRPV